MISVSSLRGLREEHIDRRLAAILVADIAGYSRLMGTDEEGTLHQLKVHRKELVDPKITEHHGRIVKTTGDGMLVEFVSVVDAVRCAVDIQRGMLERNSSVPAESRIQFRIGINVGDIIIDSDDISAMASTWRQGCRRWPTPVASWFRASCATKSVTSSVSVLRIWGSRPSKTSRTRSACTGFGSLNMLRRKKQPRRSLASPNQVSLIGLRSRSCPSQI
jgi:hypothetical protein